MFEVIYYLTCSFCGKTSRQFDGNCFDRQMVMQELRSEGWRRRFIPEGKDICPRCVAARERRKKAA